MTKQKNDLLAGTLAALLCAAITLITLILPGDRNLGLIFRQKLFILPAVFLLTYLAVSVKNVYLKALAYPLLFGIFLLPLMGLWNSGASSQYIFAGTIPWSDAFIHHLNTLRFLFGGSMEQSSAIRPLALTFNALVLLLSDNNGLVLYGLTAMLVAGSVLLTLPLITGEFGPAAAALFLTNAFFFVRAYLGSFMTEPYSFIIGYLSAFFLIHGANRRKTGLVLLGFLSLSLALNIRPSAIFVYVTAGLWFFFHFMKQQPKRLLMSALAFFALLSGFALSELNTRFVAQEGQAVTNDQAAYNIYGLCMGGKDVYDAMGQPDLAKLLGTDDLWPGLWDICRTELSAHPENVLSALAVIGDGFLLDQERGVFSYIDGAQANLVGVVRYGLMVLWLIGLVIAWQKRKEPFYSLLLAMILGIFLSQLVAPAYNVYRMRLNAPVIWLSGLVSGIGLQALLNRLPWFSRRPEDEKEDHAMLTHVAVAAISLSILIALAAAPLIKQFPIRVPEPTQKMVCAPDESLIYTRVDPGNAVFLQSYDLKQPHAPDFHLLYVRPRIHDTSSREIFDFIDAFDHPLAIIKGIDFPTGNDVLIFADLPLLTQREGYVQVCGEILPLSFYHQYQFMLPTKISFVE